MQTTRFALFRVFAVRMLVFMAIIAFGLFYLLPSMPPATLQPNAGMIYIAFLFMMLGAAALEVGRMVADLLFGSPHITRTRT